MAWWRRPRGDAVCSLQGCMERVQAWLQENLAIILGVCVGVAVIEVSPSPTWSSCSSLPSPCPP